MRKNANLKREKKKEKKVVRKKEKVGENPFIALLQFEWKSHFEVGEEFQSETVR